MINLTSEQVDTLRSLHEEGAAAGNYAAAYNYLRDIAQAQGNDGGATAAWLNRAAAINSNDGSAASEFVRGATQAAGRLSGDIITDDEFQEASNTLADAVLGSVITGGAIPDIRTIIETDVSVAVKELGLKPHDWAGTWGDILPPWAGGLGGDYASLPTSDWRELGREWFQTMFANGYGLWATGIATAENVASGLLGDLEFFGSLYMDAAANRYWIAAYGWRQPRYDPLTLDLDGDGLETVGINTASPILFDHDGDGIRTGTGWVKPDDGFLVLDRNGNGTIDSGRELFGDSTLLAGGGTAADGFAALAAEDTNADGRVDALDARFADLRIWRDLNQNGISAAGELSTLAAAGIVAIHTAKTEHAAVLADGNQIADKGTFVRSDGTAGELVEVTGDLADIDLASNPFYSDFTDTVPLTAEAQALAPIQGAGAVRDLREAASLSGDLSASVSAYLSQTTYTGRQGLLDDVVHAWADSSGMQTSQQRAADNGFTLIYLVPGQSASDYEPFLGYWSGGDTSFLTSEERDRLATLQAQQEGVTRLIATLERFNGRPFVNVASDSVTTGAGATLAVGLSAGGTLPGGTSGIGGVPRAYVSLSAPQIDLLNRSFDALKDSVYSGFTRARLGSYFDAVSIVIGDSGLEFDFSAMNALLENAKLTNPASAINDFVELHRSSGASLYLMGWDGATRLRTWVDAAVSDPALVAELTAMGVVGSGTLNGTAAQDVLFGQSGDDVITGFAGVDLLDGGDGNDTLSGGDGDDYMYGGAGDDILRAGTGNDLVYGGDGNDTLYGEGGSDRLEGGDGNDILSQSGASGGSSVLLGGAGDDQLSVAGNYNWNQVHTLEGGTGNDTLTGHIYTHDVFVFNRGDGQDTLKPYQCYSSDTLRLGPGIAPSDLVFTHVGGDLLMQISGGTDQLLFKNWFADGYARVGRIEFADGTVWTQAELYAYVLPQVGSEANDTLSGWDGKDSIDALGGDDTVRAYGGDDVVLGGAGNDVVYAGTGNDLVYGGDGNDTLYGEGGSDRLEGGDGNDILSQSGASGGSSVLLGGAGDDQLSVAGNYNWNQVHTLEGGTGNDTLTGHIYTHDVFVFNRGDGQDTLKPYQCYSSDTLRLGPGIAPSDLVFTHVGGDLLMQISGGTDQLLFKNWFADGYARVGRIEFADGTVWTTGDLLIGTDAADSISGGGGDSLIFGGGGNDMLTGGAGNDRLDGGLGSDTALGGVGNDTYVVDISTDVVTENANEGIDTIESSITLTLANNVENLTLTGPTAINGTGNTLNNILTGNSAANSLSGVAGNDTLDGLGGADTLTGGTGNDTYVLGRGYGTDTVVENDATAGNTDVAQFLSGVAADQIWFQKVGNNLETSIIGTGDKLLVKDWYLGNAYHVEQFKTADGKTLLDTQVETLVSAMAAFAPPAAGVTTLPAAYQDALQPVIAANWQ